MLRIHAEFLIENGESAMPRVKSMRFYQAKVWAESGLNCDCCVVVSECEVNVFAYDKQHVTELANKLDHLAQIKILSLKDKGKIEKVKKPGVVVVSSKKVYRGYYGNSPFKNLSAK